MFRIESDRALCADAFVAAGKEFDPQLHFTGEQDPVEMAFIQDLLNKFAAGIVAYHVYAPWPNSYSVELQFDNEEMMRACRKEYREAFAPNGNLKKKIAAAYAAKVKHAAPELEECVLDAVSKKHKTAVLVRTDNLKPLRLKYGESDFEELVASPEVVPYPTQLNRPKLAVVMDGDGIYKPLAYNRWGLVGNFVIVKMDVNGRCLSMTDEECEAVADDLLNTNGYLDPACKICNAFREPFATHGEPPMGYVPEAGAWFK